jgi:hypothetical protein
MWRTVVVARTSGRSIIGATVLALTVGCGSSPLSPTPPPSPNTPGPAPPAPAPAPAPAPQAPSVASLVIEDTFAIAWDCARSGCRPLPRNIYEVRFLLRETAGLSGATITLVVVRNPSQRTQGTYSQATGESCWLTSLRVPPRGTLDVFHTDAGSAWLSYCYVGIDGAPGIPSLELDVHFVDDLNGQGVVSAVVTRFQ